MATVKFIEPGLDATQDTSLFAGKAAVTYDSTQSHVGTGSMKCTNTAGGVAGAWTADGVAVDAGGLVSFWARFDTPQPAAITCFLLLEQAGNGSGVMGLGLNTNGTLRFCNHASTVVSGSTVLSANTWYRISVSYTNASTSTWAAKIYINGVQEISADHTGQGNGDRTGIQALNFGPNTSSTDSFSTTSAMSVWFDSIYVDDRTDLSDCGAVDATAKRSFSNGTTTGFTTQIGSGGSGYGSGHTPQVNERPLSTTNGWSMIGAGSAITEEYTIEGQSVGDVNITGSTILDYMGWIYASSALSETAQIIVGGSSTGVSLTSTNTAFKKVAGSSTYPAGGTDIGITTATTVTTVSLYEAGIIVAYIPATSLSVSVSDTITTSESMTPTLVNNVSVSDSATLTENVKSELNSFINISDSITLSESIKAQLESNISVSDSIVTTEFVDVIRNGSRDISVSDSLSLTESIAANVGFPINVNDTVIVREDHGQSFLLNGDFESAPAFTAATNQPGVWIDGTAAGSTTNSTYGWGILGSGALAASAQAQFDSSTSFAGSNSMKLSTLDATGKIVVANYAIGAAPDASVSIPLLPSTTYVVTGVIKTNNAAASSAFIDFREYNKSFGTITTTSSTKFSGTNSFTQVSFNVTTNNATAWGATLLRLNVAGNISDAWFDAVTVKRQTPDGNLVLVSMVVLSETVSTSESLAVTKINNISVSDSTSLSESLSTLESIQISVSDTISTAESSNAALVHQASVSDSTTLTENVKSLSELNIAVSDTIATSESLLLNVPININVSDSVSLSENISVSFVANVSSVNVSDSTSLSESINVTLVSNVAVTETPFIRDDVGQNLIQNPGFENAPNFTAAQTAGPSYIDGTAGGSGSNTTFGAWAIPGSGITAAAQVQFDNTVSHSGTYSIKLSTTNTSGTVNVSQGLSGSAPAAADIASAVPSRAYSYSVWVKTNNVATNAVWADVREFSGTLSQITTTSSSKLSGTNDWTKLTINWTTNNNTRYIQVILRNNVAGNIGDASFDDNILTLNSGGNVVLVSLVNTSDSIASSENVLTSDELNVNTNNTVATSESLGITLPLAINVSETVATSESVNAGFVNLVSVSDSLSVSDSVSAFQPHLAVNVRDVVETRTQISGSPYLFGGLGSFYLGESYLAEADNISYVPNENVLAKLSISINVSDSVHITDTPTMGGVPNINVSDTINTSESILVSSQGGVAVLDTINTTENLTVQLIIPGVAVSDTTSISESKSLVLESNINKSESVSVSENTIVRSELNINVSDGIGVTEQVSTRLPVAINVNDSITVSETAQTYVGIEISKNESVSVVEIVVSRIDLNIILSESVVTSEQLNLQPLGISINVSDSTSLSEFVDIIHTSDITISVSESVTVSESIVMSMSVALSVSDSIGVTENTLATMESLIAVSDSAHLFEFTNLGLNPMLVSVSDTASVADILAVIFALRFESDTDQIMDMRGDTEGGTSETSSSDSIMNMRSNGVDNPSTSSSDSISDMKGLNGNPATRMSGGDNVMGMK